MKFLQSLGLLLGAVLLSFSTLVLSSVPLLLLRRVGGGPAYWILSLSAGLALVLSGHMALWAPFLSVIILVGIYAELEAAGFKVEVAALLSLVGCLAFVLLNVIAVHQLGAVEAMELLREGVRSLVERVQEVNPSLKIDAEMVLPQIPSAAVVLMMFSLWMALIVDRKIGLGATKRDELSSFRVPEPLVWVFLLGVLGSFGELNDPQFRLFGQNAFNIMLFAYFLQGLAVTGAFFRQQKVGLSWRILGYFILIGQLFVLVSFMGFVDLWIDFRRRMTKKSAETMGEV